MGENVVVRVSEKDLIWAVVVRVKGKDLMMVFPTREEAEEMALKEGGYLVRLSGARGEEE